MSLAVPIRSRSDNLRGILAMLAAMGSLIFNDAFLTASRCRTPI